MIYQLQDRRVTVKTANYYVAPDAAVIGAVSLGDQVSVWFNAVLRGDNDEISIGDYSNIQDGAVLHTDPGFPLQLGEGVSVGHKAMLHGCSIGDYSLIGINAVVLNGAKIGKNCLVGANTLIPEGMEVPDNTLVVGDRGKVQRPLKAEQLAMLERIAQSYTEKIARYRDGLVAIEPDVLNHE